MPLKKKPKSKKPVIPKKQAAKKHTITKKRTISPRVSNNKTAVKPSPKPKTHKNIIIGKIIHYFPHVNAAVVKLKAPLKIGDTIKIKGHTSDFTETVSSIQIDRLPIQSAKKGQEIGLLVTSRVRRKDTIYKL